MISVSAMGVKNLRSLEDTGHIDIKPITLLVGRNSSGKSTFARLFPLMKQSFEATKTGPILWWGRLVDFGSFKNTINRSSDSNTMVFSFRFKSGEGKSRFVVSSKNKRILNEAGEGYVDLDLSISGSEKRDDAFISKINIRPFGLSCEVVLDEIGWVKEIKTDSYQWKQSEQFVGYAAQDRLIPSIEYYKKVIGNDGSIYFEPSNLFYMDVVKAVKPFVHHKTSNERIQFLIDRMVIGSYESMFAHMKKISIAPSSFRENLGKKGVESKEFRRLCDVFLVAYVNKILNELNEALSSFSSSAVYLEPLRATAQRYYRQQTLAVGEIDSKGENIAMFFANLPDEKMSDFNGWSSKYFGVKVIAKKDGGHVSLMIQHEGERQATNIADMGFGFSQVLPIAVQLWSASTERVRSFPMGVASERRLIVIEQPELHLHPEYQARLADIFAAASAAAHPNTESSGLGGVNIVAETHSPNVINRLGELVAAGVVAREHVQVLLFEQDEATRQTKVRKSSFNKDGVLEDWPFGFFEPSWG